IATFRTGRRDWLRDRLRLDEGIFIVSLGRNVPKKHFDIGIRAFAVALKSDPRLRYVHVGRDAGPLESLAASLGVGDRFHALGELPHSELVHVLHSADIYLSPAAVEGFSLANVEAMASGLPCIVTDGPGNRDAGRSGVNGWVVPVGDVERMAEAI